MVKPKGDKPTPGDLVHIVWFDASIGIRLSGREDAPVDVQVDSVGVFIGVVGAKVKQYILSQNSFQYADGLFDIDYTSIPAAWIVNVKVVQPQLIPKEVADRILECFLVPGHRGHTPRGIRIKRTKNKDVGKNKRKYNKLLKKLEKALSESEKDAKEKTRQYIVRAVGSNVVVGGKTATTTFKRKRGV